MTATDTGRWSLESDPHLWRVLFVVPIVAWTGWSLWTAERIAWMWLAAGFGIAAVVLGPLAASAVGSRVDAPLESLGDVGRAVVIGVVIVSLAVFIGTAATALDVPAPLLADAANGVVLGVATVVAVEAALSWTDR
jgi:hypothetical protein